MPISDPTDISNLALWLDAADNASVGAPVDGGAATKWDDLSGGAFNLTVVSTPTWHDNSGESYVLLDGVDDYFFRNADLGMLAAGACSVFARVRRVTFTGNYFVCSGRSGSNNPLWMPLNIGDDGGSADALAARARNDAGANNLDAVLQASVFTNGADLVIGSVFNGTSLTPWVDGTEGSPTSYTPSGAYTFDRFSVGALLRGVAISFNNIRVYQLVVYFKALNDTEALDISNYLAGVAPPITTRRRRGTMIWSPSGPTVVTDAAPKRFVPTASGNIGGVARVVGGAADATFTLGTSTVTNTMLIPILIGQDLFIAYGPNDTHIFASAADVRITPGIGRT